MKRFADIEQSMLIYMSSLYQHQHRNRRIQLAYLPLVTLSNPTIEELHLNTSKKV